MQLSQTEINGKISKTLLARVRAITPAERGSLAELVAQFDRACRTDALILAALVRTLKSPRGTARNDVAAVADWVRSIVAQELKRD